MQVAQIFRKAPAVANPDQDMVVYTSDIGTPAKYAIAKDVIALLKSPNGAPLPRYQSIKNDLTAADFAAAEDIIRRDMSGQKVAGLDNIPDLRGQDGLDRIDSLKRAYFRPRIDKPTDRVKVTAALIDTFWNPEIRSTAKAIADRFGSIPNYIDIGSLQHAKDLLASNVASLTKEIPELAKVPNFADHIGSLNAFMERANNGIANHGPFNLGGRVYSPVFRLAKLPQYEVRADVAEGERLDSLTKMLNEFEVDFKDTGYDRIYIDGGDGNLYVGIRNDGPLAKDVPRYALGTFMKKPTDDSAVMGLTSASSSLTRNTGEPEKLGRVLRIVDVANNHKEAATQSFTNIVLNTVRNARKNSQEALPLYVSGGVGPAPYYSVQSTSSSSSGSTWLRNVGVTALGGGAAGALTSFATAQSLLITGGLIAVAIVGAVATGVGTYAVERTLTPQTVNPFWYAAGVAFNAPEMRADEA